MHFWDAITGKERRRLGEDKEHLSSDDPDFSRSP
jgi:hypothetical protein